MSEHTQLAQDRAFEIGVYTFGELFPDPLTGQQVSAQEKLQQIIAAAKLADEAGLDLFGVGEHHSPAFAVTAPSVVLGAIAQATKRIRLTTATTVLSTVDPVRLFEEFATLDLLSNGRAEIMAGRGAFVESFPLFGYDLQNYDELFEEKLDLWLQLNAHERVTWSGRYRAPLQDAAVAPRPLHDEVPVWIGVGGTPESAARAGRLGLPMTLVILGGDPVRFKPLADLYRRAANQAGHDPARLRLAVASHGYVGKTSEQAIEEFYPYYVNYYRQVFGPRGGGAGPTRAQFEQLTHRQSALAVGSPQQVIEKILYQHELFGHSRFIMQLDIGGQPFAQVASAIELLATEVAPVVRRKLLRTQA